MPEYSLQPQEIDLTHGLLSTFGCCEFEHAAIAIIGFLSKPLNIHKEDELLFSNQQGWKKGFRITNFPDIGPALFAMMCASGWIENVWFPKYVFRVSDGFIQRVIEKNQRDENGIPIHKS